jgi:hypothetical protein
MHCVNRSFNLKVFLVIIEHLKQCIRFNLTLRMSLIFVVLAAAVMLRM